jgi:hypothetical protein
MLKTLVCLALENANSNLAAIALYSMAGLQAGQGGSRVVSAPWTFR